MQQITRSTLVATLATVPLLLSATAAWAQSADIAEPVVSDATVPASQTPYYGPGWSGPVTHAGPTACPAWYSPHAACIPGSGSQGEGNYHVWNLVPPSDVQASDKP